MTDQSTQSWTSEPAYNLERPPGEISQTRVVSFSPDGRERAGLELRPGAVAGTQPALLRLIAGIAARFVTIGPDAIDDTVIDSLGQISDVLHCDRAIVWRKDGDDASAAASHNWIRQPQPLREPFLLASLPFATSRLEAGEAVWFTHIDEVPESVDRESFLRHGLRSAALVPIPLAGGGPSMCGALGFGSTTEYDWTSTIIEQLRLVSAVFGQALARKASLTALQRARDELHEIRERMTAHGAEGQPGITAVRAPRFGHASRPENLYVCRETGERFGDCAIVGRSAAIRRVLEQARQVAATDSTVLLLGETGTGKELVATQIHELSARRGRVMARINCSAIPATLIESELFGREKGAYTGALARQIGRFELADHSTIFLDEIGDLALEVQVKLLRVLEERQIERLGSPKPVRVDVRIIAATHRNLEKQILENAFREDLFYRLNVFPIQVPPLRDRPEDIPLLVWRFVEEFSRSLGRRVDAISRESMVRLQQYAWPGNIRELRNVIERAMIVATDSKLTIALPSSSCPARHHSDRMADVEKEHIRSVLESTGWRIRGSNGAADRLGLRPTTLETRMAKLGLSRPKRP